MMTMTTCFSTVRRRRSCLALRRAHLVQSGAGVLQYKPRDSGVVVTDEGTSMDIGMGGTIGASGSLGGLACGDYLSVMPRASACVSSIYSDVDQELVTPGFGPCRVWMA